MDTNDLVRVVTEAVVKGLEERKITAPVSPLQTQGSKEELIPLGISNRHVHLAKADLFKLFGEGTELTKFKDLSQPGQFACSERLTLVGPKGVLENVRILGPLRSRTQIELSVSDCIKLGINAPVRDSGDLKGSAGLTLVGPKGALTLAEGAIIAARHIHMHSHDARRFAVKDGDRVNVKVSGARGLIFNKVLVRVSDHYQLEMHIDFDEANAARVGGRDLAEIVKL
ncbi:MAG: phosphate propanoyltransferase [Peptococcaceae bacterium]